MMNGYNDDIHQRQIDKLVQLFPEAVAEGKIDWQRLQATLGKAVDLGERYGLDWKGKSDVFATIQEKTVQTLHPDRANSVDWDTTGNMFIEGDNLAALKILHKAYYGKVKMIYIDPPYNTGNDFIYNDDFKQTRRSYETEAGITDDEGNVVRDDGLRTNTGGHKHSNWLNMMYPRLFLARNLLRQDGVIFVSIDDNEVHNLRLMMNEIFGEENYVNSFVWVNNLKGRQISGHGAARTYEHIVCFARKIDLITEFRANVEQLKRAMPSIYKGFDYEVKSDKYGNYVLKNELYNSNSAFNEDTRPNLIFDIFYNPNTCDIKVFDVNEISRLDGYVKIDPKINNDGIHKYHAYRWSRDKVVSESYNLEFVKTSDSYKIYTKVRNIGSTIVKDVIADINTTHGSSDIARTNLDSKLFDFPKPTLLIYFLAMIGLRERDVILDFFSGSGTTAHAVAELNAEDGGNRRWICVQLPELTDEKSEAYKAGYRTIADIARERIRRAGAKIRADQADKLASRNVPLDLGFRAYRVGDSNFKQWNELVSDPEEIRQQALANLDPLEEGTTDDDLLIEFLLKRGISPLAKIEQHDSFCFIPSEELVICLAHSMTEELFVTILATKPSSIVLLDRAFGDDINLKVNLLLQAERQGVEVEVV